MIRTTTAYAQLTPINKFFEELPPPSGFINATAIGYVDVYQCVFGLEEDKNSDLEEEQTLDYLSWKNQISVYVKNAEESSSSSNNIEWLNDDRRQKKIIYMINAMRMVNQGGEGEVFKGGKPYRYFKESSMAECEEDFADAITDVVTKIWAETSNEKLWEVIDRAVKQIVGQEEMCEIYAYEPAPEDDPLGNRYHSLSSCYFFYCPNHELISMQFAVIPLMSKNAEMDAGKLRESEDADDDDDDAAADDDDYVDDDVDDDVFEDLNVPQKDLDEEEEMESDDYADYRQYSVSSEEEDDQDVDWKNYTFGGSDDDEN